MKDSDNFFILMACLVHKLVFCVVSLTITPMLEKFDDKLQLFSCMTIVLEKVRFGFLNLYNNSLCNERYH